MNLNNGEVIEEDHLAYADPSMEARDYQRALMEKQNGFIKSKISKGSVGMNTPDLKTYSISNGNQNMTLKPPLALG